MPRTTIDIDASVLNELKVRQRRDGRALGAIASELLASALAHDSSTACLEPFAWKHRSMGAVVDLSDRAAVLDALDEPVDGR